MTAPVTPSASTPKKLQSPNATPPSSVTTTTSNSKFTSSSSIPTSFPKFSVPPDSQGLGSGAKIGIGLGVPIAVIIFVFAGFLGYRYHVRRVQTGSAVPELVHDVSGAQEVAEKEHAPKVEEMALERRQ